MPQEFADDVQLSPSLTLHASEHSSSLGVDAEQLPSQKMEPVFVMPQEFVDEMQGSPWNTEQRSPGSVGGRSGGISAAGTVALTPAPPFVDVARSTEPEMPLVPPTATNQDPTVVGLVMRCVPEPDADAFVPISIVTTLPIAIVPPSPAQAVIVTVCPENPTDICSDPLQSAAVVRSTPSSSTSTSSSVSDESVNADGNVIVMVCPSETASAVVMMNLWFELTEICVDDT